MIPSFKQFLIESDIDAQLKKHGIKRTNKFAGIGKEIGGEVYLHRDYEYTLPPELLKVAKQSIPEDYDYQVVKFNPKTGTFSFIKSNDFDTEHEPSVNGGITVKADGSSKPFPDAGWIYHHKWLWVADDYQGFDVEESKRRSLNWVSLPNIDKSRIGQRTFWNKNVTNRLGERMWIKCGDEVKLYSEYMLSEAIKPSIIEYGTDFYNKEWKSIGRDFYITFFKTEDYVYSYLYREGYIGFYASDLKDESKVLSSTSIDDILSNPKLFTAKDTSKFIQVFNNFFFITLGAITHFKADVIYFDGDNKALGNLYDSISRNPSFLKVLGIYGFEYKGKSKLDSRNFFTFGRIGVSLNESSKESILTSNVTGTLYDGTTEVIPKGTRIVINSVDVNSDGSVYITAYARDVKVTVSYDSKIEAEYDGWKL